MAGEYHHVLYLVLVSTPLLVSSMAFLLYWAEFLYYLSFEPDISGQVFDFIIVGGGSAGCVLANRLSEESSWRVLLLEAGGSPSLLTSLPTFTPALQLSSYDWQVETAPQKDACKSMVGGRCRWPSGKMLGGSGGLNYMLYTRGEGGDYDSWAADVKDQSWNYTSLLPYFSRSLEQQPVVEVPHTSLLASDYMKLALELGHDMEEELPLDSPQQAAFQLPRVNQEGGYRADTYRSYLRSARRRPNLTVVKHAQVTRVLVEEDTAVGVTYSRYGVETSIRASREVLLSAGTVNSPKLLLLSGIGPASHLHQHGIPVVKDLPVGKNLQDHLTTSLGPFMLNSSVCFDPSSLLNPWTYWQFVTKGTGPIAGVGVDTMAFLHSGLNPEDSRPDHQLMFMSSWLLADYWTLIWKTFGLDGPRLWEGYFRHLYYPRSLYAVSILPIILRPYSRGEVRLSSPSPWAPPIVDPGYLSHPKDKQLLVAVIQQTLIMVNSSSHLRRHGFTLPQLHWPGCETFPLFSTSYWECYVSEMSLTMYHPVGTCRMAANGDPRGVTDSHLRVKGIKGLRVVDASIMPTIVSANTNAATVVIAEKAADMVKEHWRKKSSRKERKNRNVKIEL